MQELMNAWATGVVGRPDKKKAAIRALRTLRRGQPSHSAYTRRRIDAMVRVALGEALITREMLEQIPDLGSALAPELLDAIARAVNVFGGQRSAAEAIDAIADLVETYGPESSGALAHHAA